MGARQRLRGAVHAGLALPHLRLFLRLSLLPQPVFLFDLVAHHVLVELGLRTGGLVPTRAYVGLEGALTHAVIFQLHEVLSSALHFLVVNEQPVVDGGGLPGVSAH